MNCIPKEDRIRETKNIIVMVIDKESDFFTNALKKGFVPK